MSALLAVALLGWIAWPMIRTLTAHIAGRAGLALFAFVGVLAVLQHVVALQPGVLGVIAVLYFGVGGVLYAWDSWQDGAASRIARAKAAQLAPGRMRRPLPPPAPPPAAPRPNTPPTQGGTP